ncbi:hypothetical protein BJ085DRAFT_31130 [Dimargaris cristalligena]|uniref:Uncharacterized protein n=1 Tax=Dimargaris cristalligena TaxID=215637 RepID=A0A4P9ZLF8_9FUNG|nr:hypothetical protein BJ085DRAFT_31130 [Dimargaris cristalligena]|eukprot:RKP34146.1 hypothetical protein BJ085DRAFT_31130 [Dimargaris cristalligena]
MSHLAFASFYTTSPFRDRQLVTATVSDQTRTPRVPYQIGKWVRSDREIIYEDNVLSDSDDEMTVDNSPEIDPLEKEPLKIGDIVIPPVPTTKDAIAPSTSAELDAEDSAPIDVDSTPAEPQSPQTVPEPSMASVEAAITEPEAIDDAAATVASIIGTSEIDVVGTASSPSASSSGATGSPAAVATELPPTSPPITGYSRSSEPLPSELAAAVGATSPPSHRQPQSPDADQPVENSQAIEEPTTPTELSAAQTSAATTATAVESATTTHEPDEPQQETQMPSIAHMVHETSQPTPRLDSAATTFQTESFDTPDTNMETED